MIQVISRPSPHHSHRHMSITALVIHDTATKDAQSAIHWFLNSVSKVSAHYIVDTDGTIYGLVPEDRVAWHAGMSELWGVDSVNDFSVGIEIASFGKEYSEAQMAAVLELSAQICVKYQIHLNRVVGHRNIATPWGRKVDPGDGFPWYEFLLSLGSRMSALEIEGEPTKETS